MMVPRICQCLYHQRTLSKPWAWRIVGKLQCGPKWAQIKTQHQQLIVSTMALFIAPYDHPFYPILNILINKSNHQKIQEHVPSEWDVGLGKHLQCCSIVPPPTHYALRLPWIILKLSFSKSWTKQSWLGGNIVLINFDFKFIGCIVFNLISSLSSPVWFYLILQYWNEVFC